jgi:bacteriorhodopsin
MHVITENPVFFSYAVTFGFLLGSTAMTFLESLYIKPAENSSYSYLASALMIETGVNVVAGYFYYTFVQMIVQSKVTISQLGKATSGLRSLDWLITTPFMLLSLMLFFMFDDECHRNCTSTVTTEDFWRDGAAIIVADIFMIILGSDFVLSWLSIGGMGAMILFLLSCGLFALIVLLFNRTFYDRSKTRYKTAVTVLFLGTWGLYPVFRMLEMGQAAPGVVQIGYNVLDLLSKGGFGVLIFVITTLYNFEEFAPAAQTH